MKVFVYPPNSLILADLVERSGHQPLVIMSEVGEHVTNPDIDSPPLNITEKDLKLGLRYVAIEAPSGIRGRMGLIGPLIDQSQAAIIIENADLNFGCLGCARAANYIKYLVKKKQIPILTVQYPTDEPSAKIMVKQIKEFLQKNRDL